MKRVAALCHSRLFIESRIRMNSVPGGLFMYQPTHEVRVGVDMSVQEFPLQSCSSRSLACLQQQQKKNAVFTCVYMHGVTPLTCVCAWFNSLCGFNKCLVEVGDNGGIRLCQSLSALALEVTYLLVIGLLLVGRIIGSIFVDEEGRSSASLWVKVRRDCLGALYLLWVRGSVLVYWALLKGSSGWSCGWCGALMLYL